VADQAHPRDDRQRGFSTVFWSVIATDQALHLTILANGF
jgi:hypothetical protein